MKSIKLALLKRTLRKRYLAFRSIQDEFSCGARLAEHISSRLCEARDRLNETIRKIKAIDPTAELHEVEPA